MANCNLCNGTSNGRTCVGALNSVCRSGCRHPYYMGPCPPAPCTDGCGNSCGCADGCGNCSGCTCGGCGGSYPCGCGECEYWEHCGGRDCGRCRDCGNPCHGMFKARGPICLAAGESVDFETCGMTGGCFAVSYGDIVIRRPGTYYAAITVNIPKGADVDTVMSLALNGRDDALAEIPVTTDCSSTTASFTGHAVFRAGSGALLKLTTLNDLEIPCASGRPVFTLTLIRIDGGHHHGGCHDHCGNSGCGCQNNCGAECGCHTNCTRPGCCRHC